MTRFSRGMGMRPVVSLKHVIDTNGGITGASPSTTDVINTVEGAADTGSPNANMVGSRVGSIFLNVQVIQKIVAGGVDNIYMYVYKNPGGDVTGPPVDNVGSSDDRKRVIHQEMVMTGNGTSDVAIPKTLFKGVILIPRGLRRNGDSDRLQVVIGHRTGEVTQQSNFCLQCIYKEYR